MSVENPISAKVVAACAGAGLGSALTSLVIWLLGVFAWGASAAADSVDTAIAAVPTVTVTIGLVIMASSAALPGYKVTYLNRTTPDQRQLLQSLQDDQAT